MIKDETRLSPNRESTLLKDKRREYPNYNKYGHLVINKKMLEMRQVLDPLLEKLDTSLESISVVEDECLTHVSKENLLKFNPYHSLVGPELPDSFYAVLSIFNRYTLISCDQFIHNEGCVCVDLDETPGFIMATQGRYPDTIFYSLSSKNFDEEGSGVILLNVHTRSITYEDLLDNCMSANPRGVDFCFCSSGVDINDTLERLNICITALKNKGFLIVYLTGSGPFAPSADLTTVMECTKPLIQSFESVMIYKPATSSLVSSDFYVVCTGRFELNMDFKCSETHCSRKKYKVPNDNVATDNIIDRQYLLLEEWRRTCIKSIINGIDNTKNCDVETAKINYLSL